MTEPAGITLRNQLDELAEQINRIEAHLVYIAPIMTRVDHQLQRFGPILNEWQTRGLLAARRAARNGTDND